MSQKLDLEQTPLADSKPGLDSAYPYGPRPALLPKPATLEPPDDWPLTPLAQPPLAEALAIGGCLTFNFFLPIVIDAFKREPIVIIFIAIGVIWAQFAALSTVLVFSPAPFWSRLAAVWAIGYGLALAFLVGLSVVDSKAFSDGLRVLGCGLPLVGLAAQLPLWAARIYFGWQIARPAEPVAPPRPLSIGDIFIGTAIAAAAVGVARFVVERQADRGGDFWLAWAVGVSATAAICLVSVPPAIYLGLRVEQRNVGCAVAGAYAFVAAVATLIIMSLINRSPPPEDVLIVIPIMIGSYAAALWGLTWLARVRGYRLVLPGDCWVSARE